MAKKKSYNDLKYYYMAAYPSDDLGPAINPAATFTGLLGALISKKDICDYIGVRDSVIRERLFRALAEVLGVDYENIYDLWLYGVAAA